MIYICTKFPKNITNSFKFIQRMLKIIKGHKSVRNEGGVTDLDLCISSDSALYL